VITDKATVEIPSPYAGAVTRIHVEAGQVVPVGTVLVTIGDVDTASPDGTSEIHDAPKLVIEEVIAPDAEPTGVKATPPVRKLARSLGVDLREVTGSGPEGRILREDVEAVAEMSGEAQAAAAAPSPSHRQPLRGIRRAVAERMAEAHRLIPAVTHVEECDVTELDATRRIVNEGQPAARLTYLPFVLKAVARALEEHPALNASLDADAGEIVLHDRFNIGVAVDTAEGLIVPVVQDAGIKSLSRLAREIEDLATRARAGSLSPEELRGGTFTVTSPGAFGGLMATPIILHPQTGILGVHRAVQRPVVRDNQIVIRRIMNLSVSFDHRVLDGMTAARFAMRVAGLLEHPGLLALDP
jgi:pyruvate dehydrogenase E2 component (dihydrolipoamide acetyltransferase)